MLHTKSVLWLALLVSAVAVPPMIAAQQDEDAAAAEEAEESQPRGRLPNHFGKIGVSEEQRLKIYGIQADYNAQVDELLAQVEELRGERDAAIEAVLTPGQRERLKELREEAARNRAARRQSE
ncbi:MAG: hypothetical protein DWQ34_27580 [Planctomycetota bacterium]|nr:MAG: hypothetical protein DWQ34_27580 [Planctomycetota bacterium]REJ94170.1 MAG: hypothetical protein DWQ29_03140 [Planctomycetota bacterium]REK21169.1 MAG: hypothetical protein DWQ41_22420 [Planctomycetota bacterium]REK29577.1 MAG: hypothetical protein DWQ45_22455 [Planctomycetota bacterium]